MVHIVRIHVEDVHTYTYTYTYITYIKTIPTCICIYIYIHICISFCVVVTFFTAKRNPASNFRQGALANSQSNVTGMIE